jgi:predicted ABC-type ATPase
MRVIAGPNGLGKTTMLQTLKRKGDVPFGVYVNADDIELQLNVNKILVFNQFQLNVSEKQVKDFFSYSNFSPVKRAEPDLWKKIKVLNNNFQIDASIDSYLAADLAEFIRQQLLKNEISFTYETVMSHPNKLTFMQLARDNGYRVYLYFIATMNPKINVARVNLRVSENGHGVSEEVIKSRYYRSLNLLKDAVKLANRAYIFDNSGLQARVLAEVENNEIRIIQNHDVPAWFVEYLLDGNSI